MGKTNYIKLDGHRVIEYIHNRDFKNKFKVEYDDLVTGAHSEAKRNNTKTGINNVSKTGKKKRRKIFKKDKYS